MPALLDNISTKIKTAKEAGYGESEILDYLDSQEGIQGKVKTARDAGYQDADILDYLSKPQAISSNIQTENIPRETIKEEKPSALRQIGNVVKDIAAAGINPEVREIATKSIPNIPGDFYSYAKGILGNIKPSKESYYVPGGEMARGIVNLGIGAVEKLIPGKQEKEPHVDALVKWAKETHGSWEAYKKYAIEHPVQAAAEVSTLFSLGGGAAVKAGQLAKSPSVMNVGGRLAELGRTIEPINATINLAKPIAKIAGTVGAQLHGRFMSGAGAEATKQAFGGDPEFIKTLRGAIDDQTIIDNSKNALRAMRKKEIVNYGEKFKAVEGYNKTLDLEPTKSLFETERAKRLMGKASPLSGVQKRALSNMKEHIEAWPDTTAIGMDALKQSLDDFYKGTSDSRVYDSLVQDVRNSVKSQLTKNIPEYAEMTKKYSDFLKLEEEITKSLSMGNKTAMDTTLRKLMSTMRENFEYRKELVEHLDEASGGKLLPQIAGLTMQSYFPKGLIGKLEIGAIPVLTYLHGIDPVLGTALLMSSPRISAEFLYLLGKSAKGIGKAAETIESVPGTTARQVMSQVSKNTEE